MSKDRTRSRSSRAAATQAKNTLPTPAPATAAAAASSIAPPPVPPAAGWRAFIKWFLLIVAFALLVRAVNARFILTPGNPMFDPTGMGRSVDMTDNHIQALEVIENHGFPTSYFQHSPLYVYIIAAVYLVTGGGFAMVYWLQLVAGALVCGMVYATGRLLFAERTARLAALLAALYAPLLHYELIYQSDALAPFFVMALFWLALLYERSEKHPLALACAMGVVLGLCASQRSNLALLGPALALWILFVLRRFPLRVRLISVALVAVLSLALIAPFCIHNTRVIGKLTLMQGNVDYTVAVSNGTESTGYFNYPQGCPNNPLWPFFSLGFLKLQLRKLSYLLAWFEFPDLYNFYLAGHLSPLIRWNPLTFRLLGPLGLLGLLLGLRRLRPLALLYLFYVVLGFGAVAFYAAGRFRAPLVPFLCLLGAEAAWIAWDACRRKDVKLAGGCLVLLALLAVAVNSFDSGRLHSQWYSDSMFSNGYKKQALLAAKDGDWNKARLATQRMLWVKYSQVQYVGYQMLTEINRHLKQNEEAERCASLERRILKALRQQPPVDYNQNTFFPPTDTFGPIDPLASIYPPVDFIGYTPSVYPPRR